MLSSLMLLALSRGCHIEGREGGVGVADLECVHTFVSTWCDLRVGFVDLKALADFALSFLLEQDI